MELPYRLPVWLWWPICGIFLLLPFVWHGLWPLALTALAVWLLAIKAVDDWRQVALGSFLVGLGKYAGGMFWFWETYPIPGATMLDPWIQMLMIGYFWLALAGSMALGLCFIGIATFFMLRRKITLIFWPLLFVIGEVLSSLFFSIMAAGPGSYLNANFSFGYIGLLLSDLAVLVPIIAVSGLYGLSLIAAIMGLIFFLFIQTTETNRKPLYLLSLGIFGALLVIQWLVPERSIETLGVTLIAVETRFDKNSFDDPDGLFEKRQAMIDAANTAIMIPSDVVLMPEDSRLTENTSDIDRNLDALLGASPKTRLVVDTFRSEDLSDRAVLRAVYYDLEHATTTMFDKQYMVPIGEYVMTIENWSLRLFGQSKTLDHLTHNQNYVPGPIKRDPAQFAELPGLLFCFEGTAPLGVRHLINGQDVPLVLHPISHGWFNHPRIFWQHVDAMLQIQAIWNNTTIVSAGNMSPSKVYYPNGTITTGKEIYATKYWRLVEYNL